MCTMVKQVLYVQQIHQQVLSTILAGPVVHDKKHFIRRDLGIHSR